MASPTVSASLDKMTYAPGDKATLTVTYGDPDNKTFTVTVTVTDQAGNSSVPAEVQANIADPVTVSVSDDANHTWTKVSDSGSVAVYTTTV